VIAFTREAQGCDAGSFRTTWIPDERFLRPSYAILCPKPNYACRTLTFLMFTDYECPVTFFYNRSLRSFCWSAGLFFCPPKRSAAKALDLKRRLGLVLYSAAMSEVQISNEGLNTVSSSSQSGPGIGRRFFNPFLGKGSTLGANATADRVWQELACGQNVLLETDASGDQPPALEISSQRTGHALPDLGGIPEPFGQTHRHRRSFDAHR